MTPINTIKNWFTTGSKPTQSQFWSVFDSYRHKSEDIPMKDVSGLSDALVKKADASSVTIKANKDASNLDDGNKSAWKTALNIGELPDNIATYDYNIQDHVMMKDGSLLPAGDFGKNIANSHLQTTEQGGLTQNYNFAWEYKQNIFYLGKSATTGMPGDDNVFSYYKAWLSNIDIVAGLVSNNYQSHLNISESRAVIAVDTTGIDISRNSIKLKYASNIEINALNDKSLDSTYNKLLAINSAGFVAKSDGKLVFKNVIANLNPTEALEIAQFLNGGAGSAGAMSVNLISPPIIQNRFNSVEYILLRGANLNLNTTSSSIQILASDKTTVVATVPNNQIQINSNGLELTFFYNFHNFAVGTYFIKIVSGAKIYITTIDLTVVQEVTNINTSALTWDMQYGSGSTPIAGDSCVGSNFTFNMPLGISSIPKLNIKSSELFAMGDDFYLEIALNFGNKSQSSNDLNRTYLGLGYSSTTNNSNINSLVNIQQDYKYGSTKNMTLYNNGTIMPGNDIYGNFQAPVTVNVIFIKTGNLFRTISDSINVSKTLSNDSGYSLFFNVVGRDAKQVVQGQIVKAFKLN